MLNNTVVETKSCRKSPAPGGYPTAIPLQKLSEFEDSILYTSKCPQLNFPDPLKSVSIFKRNLLHEIIRICSSAFSSAGIFLIPSYILTITVDTQSLITQSVTSVRDLLQACIKTGHSGFILTSDVKFSRIIFGEDILENIPEDIL